MAHGPLDRAPVAGEHGGGAELAEEGADAADVAEGVAFREGKGGVLDVEGGGEAFAGREVAVHGNDRVAVAGAEMVGEGGESGLNAADGEGGEHVQQERRAGAVHESILTGW